MKAAYSMTRSSTSDIEVNYHLLARRDWTLSGIVTSSPGINNIGIPPIGAVPRLKLIHDISGQHGRHKKEVEDIKFRARSPIRGELASG